MTTVIYKDLATSTQKRNRFEIPLLIAVLRTKFPKEQILVHKTTNLCAIQNSHITNVTSLLGERGQLKLQHKWPGLFIIFTVLVKVPNIIWWSWAGV